MFLPGETQGWGSLVGCRLWGRLMGGGPFPGGPELETLPANAEVNQASLWNSPGKNTGVGSHSLLQGIFPKQESNQISRTAADSLLSDAVGVRNAEEA